MDQRNIRENHTEQGKLLPPNSHLQEKVYYLKACNE